MSKSKKRTRLGTLLGAAGLLTALGLGVAIAVDDETQESGEVREAAVTLGGIQVAVDPQTGELRPLTNAEAQQLAKEMRRRFPPRSVSAPTVAADGTLSSVVMPNVLRLSVARVGAEGKVAVECADGVEQAIDFMSDSRERER
jgi:hypothetical protein